MTEIQIEKNKSLLQCNSLKLESVAQYYIKINSIKQIADIFKRSEYSNLPKYVLGEGSNVVLPEVIDGVVIHPDIKGINVISDGDEEVLVKVGAGENWDEFVQWSIENEYYGVENLSLIPGSAGAAPIQNIGAYSVEFSDVCHSVDAYLIDNGRYVRFSNDACQFSYRDSVFKNKFKDKLVITYVTLRLSKFPYFNTSYSSIRERVNEDGRNNDLCAKYIREIVVETRLSKLPDPEKMPNAGSFFKNPIITIDHYFDLLKKYPKIISFDTEDGKKIAAGWLIDNAGWKGFEGEHVAVHDKQALVLVNTGGAVASDILALAEKLQRDVYDKFQIELEQEPVNLSFS